MNIVNEAGVIEVVSKWVGTMYHTTIYSHKNHVIFYETFNSILTEQFM